MLTAVQMISKLFLCVVLLNFILNSNGASAVEDDVNIDDDNTLRDERESSFFESFANLFNRLKTFFGLKTQLIEAKRKRVKSAFEVFFQELNKKNTPIPPGNLKTGKKLPVIGPKLLNFTGNRTGYKVKPETTAQQLITTHGYKSESHTVLTADGFMLTMQRIMPDIDDIRRRVVLIHHGLLESAEDWLLLGKHRALPYLLTDNGFDVWLLNSRGNRYSRIHEHMHPERKNFWDFSFHEIGLYDLPAVIRYVNEITHNAEINFIGHSMGATALLVLLSSSPEYNYILRSGILLAPLAFMYHVQGPMRSLAEFYTRNGQSSLNFLGESEFLETRFFPEQIIERYCKGNAIACFNPLLLLANGGKELSDPWLFHDILNHVPGGGSVKTIIHYVQLVKSGFFEMFDYGALDNLGRYGNSTPPGYNLKLVTLPLALFSSPSDWLASESDIQTLLPLLQHVNIHHVVKVQDFGHLDFVWSPDAPEFVYDFILNILHDIVPTEETVLDI